MKIDEYTQNGGGRGGGGEGKKNSVNQDKSIWGIGSLIFYFQHGFSLEVGYSS